MLTDTISTVYIHFAFLSGIVSTPELRDLSLPKKFEDMGSIDDQFRGRSLFYNRLP